MDDDAQLPAIRPAPVFQPVPMNYRSLPPMPRFHGNAAVSFVALVLFPDDEELARKYVARWLIEHEIPQTALDQGVRLDNEYMAALYHDTRGEHPTEREIKQRQYWSSGCGQVVKTMFALVNANDPRVRDAATAKEAFRQVEAACGRTLGERQADTSLRPWMRLFKRSLHMAAALELRREDVLQPARSPEGWMLNAVPIPQRLYDWQATRHFPGKRNDYFTLDAFGPWSDRYVNHGVPDIGIAYERLTPSGGQGGRPKM
jgi:hypothetical protein